MNMHLTLVALLLMGIIAPATGMAEQTSWGKRQDLTT